MTRMERFLATSFWVGWVVCAIGSVVAIWEGHDTTFGGGLAATGGAITGWVVVAALVLAFWDAGEKL